MNIKRWRASEAFNVDIKKMWIRDDDILLDETYFNGTNFVDGTLTHIHTHTHTHYNQTERKTKNEKKTEKI